MSRSTKGVLHLHFAQVTSATCWVFVEVQTGDGMVGWGEATLTGQEEQLRNLEPWIADAVEAVLQAGDFRLALAPESLPAAALVSAADMALLDIEGRRRNVSVATLLAGGEAVRREVALYANINRRSHDRSPDGFAASARAAAAEGFSALKIAPFDEVRGKGDPEPGLARVRAVREAVGPGVDLMIDCHWRLSPNSAERVIAAAAEIGLYWVECPLPETPDMLGRIASLRRLANDRGIRLAGCELGIGREGFAPFLKHGCYDVMMPDAKYVGGLSEMLALDGIFAKAGVEFSPHNPSGPICHAASLQVCAAIQRAPRLEVQFDETPFFDTLQVRPLPRERTGRAAVPDGPGHGTALRLDVLATVAGQEA